MKDEDVSVVDNTIIYDKDSRINKLIKKKFK